MKASFSVSLFVLCFYASSLTLAQTQYSYPLVSDFSPTQAGGPDLIQIPNNSGLAGEFLIRPVPASTCGQGGSASGYYFEDDAGLQFNNPQGFIGQSYSLAMNFQIDELNGPPSWVRLLSFTHVDDIGIYIKLTNPPTNGTLEFWPYGLAGQYDFFNSADFYQLVLVRNESGLIIVYINGEEFAQYDDSGTQKFVPGAPDNFIVFFRDHPSVLANEASPGFVSNIIIRNAAWSANEVNTMWVNFCSSLLDIEEPAADGSRIFPNPARDFLHVELNSTLPCQADVSLISTSGQSVFHQVLNLGPGNNKYTLDLKGIHEGLYILKETTPAGTRAAKVMVSH